MANLIITVISIALVAVAALMGAYYGGEAFLNGQVKSQANQLIETSKQIATAWQMYAVNNGGNYVLTDYNWQDGTMTDLVPVYLSSIPKMSFAGPIWLRRLYNNGFHNSPNQGNVTTYGNGIITIEFNGLPEKLCAQINLIAKGTASAPSVMWAGWTNTSLAADDLTPFICIAYPPYGYYFMYRVF